MNDKNNDPLCGYQPPHEWDIYDEQREVKKMMRWLVPVMAILFVAAVIMTILEFVK